MPDCEHPKCHENIATELSRRPTWDDHNQLGRQVAEKMPKAWLRWVWLAIVAIVLPLAAAGLNVWSGQASDRLRYAHKEELTQCRIRIERLEESDRYLRRDLDEIKTNVNLILKIIRTGSEPAGSYGTR